jgi:hypothetical protein
VRKNAFVLLVALLVLPLNLLMGQTTAAQIAGTISDPSGAPVPDATVSVVNRDTQAKRETTSNASGNFSLPLLPPGTYSLTVVKSGFRIITQPEVRHPPRSGWLGELGRLKGGWVKGLDVARCAS